MTSPKFKVGDVVAYNDAAGHLILEYVKENKNVKARVRLGCKGIIVTFHDDCLNVGEFYTVSWFGGNGNSVNEVLELNLCKGIRKATLCNQCQDKVECWTIRRH